LRKKRDQESDEKRSERSGIKAQQRIDQASAEDEAVHAMVKQSIKLHGA
jgi:hypothetical protein